MKPYKIFSKPGGKISLRSIYSYFIFKIKYIKTKQKHIENILNHTKFSLNREANSINSYFISKIKNIKTKKNILKPY